MKPGAAMFKKIARKIKNETKRYRRYRGEKVFCIGRNKTGTTSIRKALSDLGYRIGNQREAEHLIKYYRDRDFSPIIEYCYTAQAFQDIPFSLPYTYVILDQTFPGSKFILSLRNSADEWYDSYVRHQMKVVGTNEIPTPQELKAHPYVWEGWLYDAKVWTGRPEDKFYDADFLKERYARYNRNVMEYFRFKENLITINLANKDSYHNMCSFLGKEPLYGQMPWKNRTR